MGFIEETGAAQHLRDAKILTIYEGTTAIQANDLVGRKTARDGGATARWPSRRRSKTTEGLLNCPPQALPACKRMARAPGCGPPRLSPTPWTSSSVRARRSPNAVFSGSVPYLMLAGTVLAGWQMARALIAAEEAAGSVARTPSSWQAKIATARFYGDHILNKAAGAARQHRRRRGRRHRPRTGVLLMALPPVLQAPRRCRSSARRCSSSAIRSW